MPKQIRGTFISFIPRLIGLSNYLSYRTTYRPYNCFLYSLTIQSSGILVDKYVRGLLESLTPGIPELKKNYASSTGSDSTSVLYYDYFQRLLPGWKAGS
jgi:hypothetical protein